ncbi:MAG: hypothetical protein ACR2GA_02455 [Chloroflexota bacterium]
MVSTEHICPVAYRMWPRSKGVTGGESRRILPSPSRRRLPRRAVLFGVLSLSAVMLTPSRIAASGMPQAATPKTWHGTIAGVPTWITVVAHGHDIVRRAGSWWTWGNTSTDTYLFAFRHPRNVRLILAFERQPNGLPQARLFLNQAGAAPLAYTSSGTGVQITTDGGNPYLTIRAAGGPWLIHHVTNYNLRLSLDGPSEYGPRAARTDGQTDVQIRVGGGTHGVPRWETDRLVFDPSPTSGYIRFGAFQRLPGAPRFRVARPIMPSFPYLGIGRAHPHWFVENPNPLYYDLNSSSFNRHPFVGFENAGTYSLTSLTLPPRVDFESPFLFTNFAPGTREAQLVIRAESFPHGDLLGPQPRTLPRSTFRMSWTDSRSNLWEYSLDVAGMVPTTRTIHLGDSRFLGIPPRATAGWVAHHSWPLVTFVQAVHGYSGSEGIYAYSAQANDNWGWLGGMANHPAHYLSHPPLPQPPALTAATDPRALPVGFRGEYSQAYFRIPMLYASPIDAHLHLLYGHGGWWNLGECWALNSRSVGHGPYINSWVLHRLTRAPGCRRKTRTSLRQSLYALGGYFLFSGPQGANIQLSRPPSSAFRVVPPTTRSSWLEFSRLTARYQLGRDPRNLRSWLRAFPGPSVAIHPAQLKVLRSTHSTLSILLSVPAHARTVLNGSRQYLPALSSRSGVYLLTYRVSQRRWTVQQEDHTHLAAVLHMQPATTYPSKNIAAVPIRVTSRPPPASMLRLSIDGRTQEASVGLIVLFLTLGCYLLWRRVLDLM